MNGRRRGAALLLPLVLAACASTPEAAPEQDREAKRFDTHPGSSTVYVYRVDTPLPDNDSVLWINGRLVGATLPGSYFRVHLEPGTQRLSGYAVDNGQLQLDTRPGVAYFVRLQVLAGQSWFEPVPPGLAQAELPACCTLLENWRPGQRPLLK